MFFLNLSDRMFTFPELEKLTNISQSEIKNDTGINDVFDRMDFAGFYQTIENVISYLHANYDDTTEQVMVVLPSQDVAFSCELIGAITRKKYSSNGEYRLKVDFYVWNERNPKGFFEYVSKG